MRLRRAKLAAVNSNFRGALKRVLTELLRHADEWGYEITDTAEVLAAEWYTDKEVKKLVVELLNELGLDKSAIVSEAIQYSAEALELLDRMLASAEARRAKAIRFVLEMDSKFGHRLNNASGRVIDAQATIIGEASAPNRPRRVQ